MPRGVYDRSKVKPESNESESPVTEATVDRQIELAYWASVQNSRDPADLEAYLEKYPEGSFVDIAERRVRQILSAEAQGGKPEDYKIEVPRKRLSAQLPAVPMPVIGNEFPKYQLLTPFFAEDNTMYPADKEIEYLGPPNEHMFPLNAAAREAKKEQEEYLDACWAVKLRLEDKPAIPRPRELADQIETERMGLNSGGVVHADELPPTRPDLRQGGAARDPRASRIGKVTEGTAFKDRPTNAPLLGRDGHRYQKSIDPGAPLAVG